MNSASIRPTWYNTMYMECYLIHSQCKYILQFNVPECSLSLLTFDFFCNHFFYCTKHAPISSQTRSICSLIFCSCINTFTQHPLTPKHRPLFTLCTQSTGQPNKAYTFCHLMILIERYTWKLLIVTHSILFSWSSRHQNLSIWLNFNCAFPQITQLMDEFFNILSNICSFHIFVVLEPFEYRGKCCEFIGRIRLRCG